MDRPNSTVTALSPLGSRRGGVELSAIGLTRPCPWFVPLVTGLHHPKSPLDYIRVVRS